MDMETLIRFSIPLSSLNSNYNNSHKLDGTMTKEENEGQKTSTITDKIISVIAVIAAIIVGRLAGFLGIGAIAVGWFIYDRTKEKLGRFMAVCAGAVSGVAIYGFAGFAVLSWL